MLARFLGMSSSGDLMPRGDRLLRRSALAIVASSTALVVACTSAATPTPTPTPIVFPEEFLMGSLLPASAVSYEVVESMEPACRPGMLSSSKARELLVEIEFRAITTCRESSSHRTPSGEEFRWMQIITLAVSQEQAARFMSSLGPFLEADLAIGCCELLVSESLGGGQDAHLYRLGDGELALILAAGPVVGFIYFEDGVPEAEDPAAFALALGARLEAQLRANLSG